MSTSGSALAYGTKAFAFLVLALVFTCKSVPKGAEQDANSANNADTSNSANNADTENYGDDENISDIDAEAPAAEAAAPPSPLPHPLSPTAWNTKALLMTTPHPPEEKLLMCHNKMLAIAKNTMNQEELHWAQQRVTTEIGTNIRLYHWCFYNSMMLLDNMLINDGMGMLLDEQARNFSLFVRGMWILAFALDRVSEDEKGPYFSFLRVRYLELSRDYFGRDLNVVSPPFGHEARPALREKKAGPQASDL